MANWRRTLWFAVAWLIRAPFVLLSVLVYVAGCAAIILLELVLLAVIAIASGPKARG